ncbi:hypothetical protein MANY_24700 [Mycolicibacterium anyangense]|uniref:Uncharacterized protein n=1 Tax=Mycolicibacterium anyangense TaxID=1431246 RepID=A0A6N4W9T9_9MYCO|nr:hypothetical protein MANY_24700 [Mycolicibacterium anyangense]
MVATFSAKYGWGWVNASVTRAYSDKRKSKGSFAVSISSPLVIVTLLDLVMRRCAGRLYWRARGPPAP